MKSAPCDPQAFRLEALVDFVDDALDANLCAEPLDARHIDAMMATLASAGVTRVSWAYYADDRGGFLLPAGFRAPGNWCDWRRCAQTYDGLRHPLRVAAEAAHRHGIELFAYFKPYEMGPPLGFPEGSPEGREWGRLPARGLLLSWMDPFVLRNPHLRIRHADPETDARNRGPVAALRLTKRDAGPTRLRSGNLQVWTSPDNYRYQPLGLTGAWAEEIVPAAADVTDLGGKVLTRRGEPVRTLVLRGLSIAEPYLLVTTDVADKPGDFVNTPMALLTAYGADGRPIRGVYGNGTGIYGRENINFREWGTMFDHGYGRWPMTLDEPNQGGRTGFVAFARGRNEWLPGALCETEPAVQQFWLSCVEAMLEAGVDGIDMREESHSTHTDFPDEYGYNDVVLARTGGDSSPAAVARARGEAYTEFLRQVSRLVRARGRRLRLNLNVDWFRPDPPAARALAYPANITFDWRRWLEEGLADEALLRVFHFGLDGVFADPVAQEMIACAAAKGLPITVNRYVQPAPQSRDEFLRVRGDGRFAGFVLYETQAFLRYPQPDRCEIRHEGVQAVCRAFRERCRV